MLDVSRFHQIQKLFQYFISLRLHGYLFTNGICDIRFDKYIVKKTFVYILSKTLFSVKWQHQRKSTEIRTRRNMRIHDMLDLHVIVVVTELKIKNIKYQKIVILHELITNTHTHTHACMDITHIQRVVYLVLQRLQGYLESFNTFLKYLIYN